MSNPISPDILATSLHEFEGIALKTHMHLRWAQNFLIKVLGFTDHFTMAYQMTGYEKRPLILVKQGDRLLFGLETGAPPVLRQGNLPYKLLFTGQDWRLYDLNARPVLILSASHKDPEELAYFHSSNLAQWQKLAESVRRCDTDTVVSKLLSPTVLQVLRQELGTDMNDTILRQHVQEIITGATPLKRIA